MLIPSIQDLDTMCDALEIDAYLQLEAGQKAAVMSMTLMALSLEEERVRNANGQRLLDKVPVKDSGPH